MKMEITSKKDNALNARTEICFIVDHARESTPGRNAVAEELAKQLGTQRNLVVIDDLETQYGVGKTVGYAKVYKSAEDIKKYEPEYLQKRNGLIAKPAEAQE